MQTQVYLLKNVACVEISGAAGTVISVSPELAKQLLDADAATLFAEPKIEQAEVGPELKQAKAPADFSRAEKPLLSNGKKR